MSNIDKKILEEIKRYNNINKYILEQEALPPAPTEEPAPALPAPGEATAPAPDAGLTPPTTEAAPEFVDTKTDTDVEKIGAGSETSSETGTEEMDITDLVTSQKDILTKQDDYFEQLFSQLSNLESKLSEMDNLMNKINSMEEKIEKYRPKTPQEKLELRTLDSGPYNQKLSDFFVDKELDMEKSGKNEYVLTSDEIENFSPSEIRGTFNPQEDKKNFGI